MFDSILFYLVLFYFTFFEGGKGRKLDGFLLFSCSVPLDEFVMWVLRSACARSRDIASYFVLPSSAVSTSHAAHCVLLLRSLLCLLCPSIASAPPIIIPITLPFLLPLRRSVTSRRANHAHARSRLGAARRLAPPFRTSSSEFPAQNPIFHPPAPHLPSWLPSVRPSSLLAIASLLSCFFIWLARFLRFSRLPFLVVRANSKHLGACFAHSFPDVHSVVFCPVAPPF